ncbi:M16 family metallopeptidase [Paludisphaera rhizosphaerae]|uniref:M16 family metallopeptidase n=1 Tax=Paludisphaera rhizosphaerae TaxID=2711216 RepID=UPI00197D3AB8|nr:pitrilysin family protein [Paludisphaera rhizosphaerae]
MMTTKRRAILSIAAVLGTIAAPAGAFAQAKGPLQEVASVEGITEYRLPNGMRVLLFPDQSKPKVTVALTVFVGSRHEGYGETGMAHLLEHMVFKGTPDHPNIPGVFKERGAQFNGTTNSDRTNYFESLTSSDDNLEFAVRLEADRMVNSPIKAEDLATEFSVVRNEFERGENSPMRILSQRIESAAFDWHNYGKSTIGNRSDIERVPVDNLRAFYKKYYQPDNAMLVVAGKFDVDKAKEYAVKYFGALPKPERELPKTYTEEPPQDGERTVTLRRIGDVGMLGIAYHVPSGPQDDFPALRVLGDVLTTRPSGRLYKALIETRKAANVFAGARANHDPSLFQVLAEANTKDRAELDKIRDVIYAELEKVAKEGVTAEEVDRAKRRYAKNFEMQSADPNSIALNLSEWAAQGDWRLYFLARDRMETVTPEDVKRVAAAYFEPSNRTVGYFLPSDKAERTPIPGNPDVAKLVDNYKGRESKSAGEAFDVTPAAIEARVQRPSEIEGVKLALLPKKTRGEAVRLTLRLHYGDAESLKGLVEASEFLGSLMSRGGTKNLTKLQLQDELDKNFATIGGGGGLGSIQFGVTTRRANLPAALELLRQVLREPLLPEAEFEVQKTGALAGLEASRTEPGTLAGEKLAKIQSKYPPDDVRYEPTTDESIARLKATTIEQIRKIYNEYLGASHGELAIVGDFEPSEIMPILEKTLKGWKSDKPYARIERPYQPGLTPETVAIETPDKANAVYQARMLFPLKDDAPDYPALALGNFILGGGSISSRIADRLRGKGGLSYSAGSSFNASPLDPRASLGVSAIYNPMNVSKVEAGVREEIERIVKEGVTEEELKQAKDGWLRRQEISRTEDGSLAGDLAQNLYLGRTLQFDADLEAKVKALDVAAVNAAIKKYVDFSKFSVVTAGDFKAAEKK